MFKRKPKDQPPDAPIHLGLVAADATRCIQCGLCGYNCPVGIPVRDYARQGLTVDDPTCITCGNCIQACPRGTLRWETVRKS
ncbi:MAG: 4Fe-4S dicluster domain-containing protein [Anaerolineae bacterium]|nr:4Fe-4S dicluster domain-containing protein [Anaerolineae bacterium]